MMQDLINSSSYDHVIIPKQKDRLFSETFTGAPNRHFWLLLILQVCRTALHSRPFISGSNYIHCRTNFKIKTTHCKSLRSM